MAWSPQEENLLPQFVGLIITTCSNAIDIVKWELLVAVDHSQLRTMVSEMVDPIEWPLPPLFTGQYSLSAT